MWNRLKIEIDAFLDVRKRTLVLETVLYFPLLVNKIFLNAYSIFC